MKRRLKPWKRWAPKRSGLNEDRSVYPLHPTLKELDPAPRANNAGLHAVRLPFIERPKEREPIAGILCGLAVAKEEKRLRNVDQILHVLLLFVLEGVLALLW
jgi:hypothetical protein